MAVSFWGTAARAAGAPSPAPSGNSVPALKHVMIVIFENTNFQNTIVQPFFGKLAHEGADLANFHAETHPSQPNYLALTSGDTHGVLVDLNVNLDAKNIVDLLEAKGKSWKVYAEGYPGRCFLGTSSGNFHRKHVPFLSYKNVQNSLERCAHIVNATELDQDIQNRTLPDYSFYVPDIKNDGHDTGVVYADKWYGQAFGPRIANKNFMDGMLLITTFDENDYAPGNQIYTSLYGDMVQPGVSVGANYTHYSVLKTVEMGLGLDSLGLNDAGASEILGVWRGTP